ncbi:MAG: S8 family serine peptidase [Rubrivivax sp.]|nr:S8 family serine peptidase [Rubrivivax sp.]
MATEWLRHGAALKPGSALAGSLLLAEPGLREWGVRPARVERGPRRLLAARNTAVAMGATAAGRQVLGVIDGRCAFAHNHFLTPGPRPRIRWLWDQSRPARGGYWAKPRGYGYGRELSADRLLTAMGDVLNDAGRPPSRAAVAEAALYALLDFEVPHESDWSHGTHVLDTALDEFAARRPPELGIEPEILFVQLPDHALHDTGGRWAAAYVLDALDYIVDRSGDAGTIVVNLSLGAFAGPHDGSTVLERAIDERIERLGGRLTVVVAAGNAGRVRDDGTGEKRVVRWGAELAGQASAQVLIDIDIPDRTETLAELWLPRRSHVEVTLENVATGQSTGAVGPGRTGVIEGGGLTLAAVVHSGAEGCPNGAGSLVLLAVGHTLDRAGGCCAPAGIWRLTLHNRHADPARARLWLERRDAPGELPGYRPQYGLREVTGVAAGPVVVSDLGSMSGGRRTVVVGAHATRVDAKDGPRVDAAAYSVSGSELRTVDVTAGGRRRGIGFFTGRGCKDLQGTSIAAARVSGALLAAGADADRQARLGVGPPGEVRGTRSAPVQLPERQGAAAVGGARQRH